MWGDENDFRRIQQSCGQHWIEAGETGGAVGKDSADTPAVPERGKERSETGCGKDNRTGLSDQRRRIKKETADNWNLSNGQNRQRITTNPGGIHNIPPEIKKSRRYFMKKLFKRFFSLLSAWEHRTDAEFAAMDEIERQQITEFINNSTY